MILRAKTKDLFNGYVENFEKRENSNLNYLESEKQIVRLLSYPRRFIFELTNACNLKCIMCGRNNTNFKTTFFKEEWIEKLRKGLMKAEEVTLMGWGEPTIHPNFNEILRRVNRDGIRKYFCTNGMRLEELTPSIFDCKVDIVAVSLDGANWEENNRIRKGGDFLYICNSLKKIVEYKKKHKLSYPYINFVFTAMKSNYEQIPDMIRLAKKIGIEEVKIVYLTVFGNELLEESLYNLQQDVKRIFSQAKEVAEQLGVYLKLPYLQGEDIAKERSHKCCYAPWRDFFLGSDGWVRPCMSTPIKFFHIEEYEKFDSMWNEDKYINFRRNVNNEDGMEKACKTCYQSSYANWNKKSSFLQIGEKYAPSWEM